MRLSERVASWRDSSPRQAALFIAAILVGLLVFDGIRLHASRSLIPDPAWDDALRVGLAFGVFLLALGGALWLVARRYPVARRPVEVLSAIVTLLVFATTHHRGGEDSIKEPWEVTYVVAGALLFSVLLTFAIAYRWTRTPTPPSGR